jgi:hypothetical protein
LRSIRAPGFDNLAIHQLEVRRAPEVYTRERPQENVVESRLDSIRTRLFPTVLLHPLYDVEALFLPATHHLGNEPRWMLQVSVHYDHRIAPGSLEAGAQRQLLAKAPTEADGAHIGKLVYRRLQELPGPVTRPIVDQDEFVVTLEHREFTADRLEGSLEMRLFVEERNHDGKLHIARAPP